MESQRALLVTALLMNLKSHNEIRKVSETFLFRRLNMLWERKMLRMDYDIFVSNRGKLQIEKARGAICSPNWGIALLLRREAALLEAGAGLIVYCLIACRLHPMIIVFLSVFFLIELVCGIRIEGRKQSFKEERAVADRRLNYIAYGTKGIQEAKDIRIFALAPMLKKITQEVIRDKGNVETKVQRLQFAGAAVTAVLILIRDGMAYWFLINRYLSTDMTIGDLSMYFTAITGIGMWLTSLSAAISEFQESRHYVQDFYEFMELSERVNKELPKKTGRHMRGRGARRILRQADGYRNTAETSAAALHTPISFELRHLAFSYLGQKDGKEVLTPIFRDFSLSVQAGEKIAIVGINGSGKTTLIKLLCRLYRPTTGRILLNGTDIWDYSYAEYMAYISTVFQDYSLFAFSIAENVASTQEFDSGRVEKALEKAGLLEKVSRLERGIRQPLFHDFDEERTDLSGGEAQKAAIARAIYKDADIMILDEPTAALDPYAECEIYENFAKLAAGKTVLSISHRLSSCRMCDRIAVMSQGTLVQCGSHEELLQEQGGKYAELWNAQAQYYQ